MDRLTYIIEMSIIGLGRREIVKIIICLGIAYEERETILSAKKVPVKYPGMKFVTSSRDNTQTLLLYNKFDVSALRPIIQHGHIHPRG